MVTRSLCVLLLLLCGCREAETPKPKGTIRVADVLGAGADTAGFRRAESVRPFVFPADHGPHPDFRSEWWYFTGNLATEGGARFGFQLTIFRSALRPEAAPRSSPFASRQLYMAHFALVAEDGARVVRERFSRGAVGLAGAQAQPFRVWLDDWSVASTTAAFFPLRLRASGAGHEFDVVLDAGKPMVLQGDRGLSQKSAAAGNASYYYSFTRLPARGTVGIGGDRHAVRGEAWMDREWSTSALGADQVGWDWFSLQLDDGRELMFYSLRRRDGTRDPLSAGVLVGVDGTARRLNAAAVQLAPERFWTSPESGARYPVAWRLAVPEEGLELAVTPLVDAQEMDVSVRYWEGAVVVAGTSRQQPVAGRGYVELVGYVGKGTGPGARDR